MWIIFIHVKCLCVCVCVCIYTYGERVRGRVTRLVLPGEKLKGSCRSSCRRRTNPHSNYGYSQQQLAIYICRNKSSTIKCRFGKTTKIRWWVAGGSSQLARITVFFFFLSFKFSIIVVQRQKDSRGYLVFGIC